MHRMTSRRTRWTYRLLSAFIAFIFSFTSVLPPAYAQSIGALNLPVPGAMVTPSAAFVPVLLKGMTIHPDNPLQFDFIVDSGNTRLQNQSLRKEASKLFKYFLAALTVPEEELWVNLSPYEKDRVIPQGFGDTEMGRDLLAQDYLLKQLTASLMYPEKELGKKFWDKVYKKAHERYGTTEVPMNTFNKVWIVPEKAVIYEQGASAFVVDAHLKVMLEEDYKAVNAQKAEDREHKPENTNLSSEIIREVILPEIEKEVNEGRTFANLRQIYTASILAAWYKMNLKTSLLGQVYADQNKTKGVDIQDKEANQKIYNQYLEAFKKGVYNYIKEDYDPATQETIPRKYFSGGVSLALKEKDATNIDVKGKTSILRRMANGALSLILAGSLTGVPAIDAEAMVAKGLRPNAADAQAYQFGVNIVGLGPKADNDYITTVSNGTLVKPIGMESKPSEGSPLAVAQTSVEKSQELTDIDKQLLKAVDQGNILEVQKLLHRGANVNAKDIYGKTALILASITRHSDLVKVLLEHNADVNAKDNRGKTALMWVSEMRAVNILKMLLDNGADLNAKNNDGDTALKLALSSKSNEVAQILIDYGVNVHDRDFMGSTTLMWASWGGLDDIVEMLLNKNVEVNARNKRRVSALMLAAQNGHSNSVRMLLKHGADNLDEEDIDHQISLLSASKNGHHEIVKMLLEYGANVDVRNSDGETALLLASVNGHYQVVHILLEYGANVVIKTKEYGTTALMLASKKGHRRIVDALLENDANVNMKSHSGGTALMSASLHGHSDIVKVLLDNYADVNMRDDTGKAAMDYAENEGYTNIVELILKAKADEKLQTRIALGNKLLKAAENSDISEIQLLLRSGVNVNFKDKSGWTALMLAAEHGQVKIAETLLNNGAKINIRSDEGGGTALMLAAINGHVDVVKGLLNKGAKIDIKANEGGTALMLAAENGHLKVVESLLKNRAEVNIKADKGVTALMLAAQNGHLKVVESLLNSGAKTDIMNNRDETALMFAAKNGHVKVVETLLNNGANINIKTFQGVTALMMAAFNGHVGVIETLINRGAEVNAKEEDGETALMYAAEKGHTKAIEALINKGAEINAKTKDGETALMIGVGIWTRLLFPSRPTEMERVKVAEILLKNGAKINTKTNEGLTALMYAVENGHDKVVEILLNNGAEVNIKANDGTTALMIAVEHGLVESVEILLIKGAQVNAKNNKGRTALYYATKHGYMEIIELLRKYGAKDDRSSIEPLDEDLESAINEIDLDRTSSPIKPPEGLVNAAINVLLTLALVCGAGGCGPDHPSQTPPSQQQIDMSQQSIVQLRDYLESTKWAEQRDAAIEIFKRYQASVTGVTISDVELARKLVVIPLIEKLTSPAPETVNSESYKRLIELGEIAIKPLKDNLIRESADINTRQWSEQLLEEIIDDVLKQFDEILPSLSVILKNPNSPLYDFAIERVEMLIRKQPLALQIPKALQLLTHATAGVRLAAANTLGDIGDESAVFGLEDAVRIEQNPQVKTAIENAISIILKIDEIQNWGDDQLKEALESPYWAVERTAIQVIFKRNNQENIVLASKKIQERINQLTSTSTNTRNSMPYLELLELGDIIKDSLKTTLNNENADINARKWSADLLEQFAQFDEILLTYESILGNTESALYISLRDRLRALIFKQPAPFNKALELIQYPASGIKIVAIRVLGDIGDLSVIPILESERKNNSDPNVISAIETALDKILTRSLTGEYEKDFVVLTDILKNPDLFLYTSAIDAFQKLILDQPAPLNKAIELLEHELVGVRVVAINVLGEAGNESVVPTLEFLRDNDPDPDIVAAAKGAIGKIFANIVAAWSDAHLMEALDDISWYVQKAAALELLKRNHAEGIALAQNKLVWPRIRELTADSEEDIIHTSAYQELIELGTYIPEAWSNDYTLITNPLQRHIEDKKANYYTRQWSIKLLSEIFPADSWRGISLLANVSYDTYGPTDLEFFYQTTPLLNFTIEAVKNMIINSADSTKRATDIIRSLSRYTSLVETVGAVRYLGEFGDKSHIPLLESAVGSLEPSDDSIILREIDEALDNLYGVGMMINWSREQLIATLDDSSWTMQKSAAKEIYRKYREGALPYADVALAREKLVHPKVANIRNSITDWQQRNADREQLLYLGEIVVDPLLALLEEVIADSQNVPYQRTWDDLEKRFIISTVARLNDPRVIDPILRYHNAYDSLSVTAAHALQDLWPESEKAVPVLVEELKWGNIGATWLVHKAEYTAEALSAILFQLRNYGPHDYPRYMDNNFAYQYGFKRHFFRETDSETFAQLLLGALPEDRDILQIIYLTNQPDHGAVTDGYLYNLIQGKTIENEVAEIFNNSEVLNALVALETMNPDVLKRDIPIVTRVEEGADLWANNNLGWLTQDMRTVALAQKSVVTKLLAQEGDLMIPLETTAHFSWSGDPDIIINLPVVIWSENDIPQLQKLLNSEYEYFRIAAQKALDKIAQGELTVVSPFSSPVGEIKTEESELGGIDLNPALLDLQIKTDGNGVPLPLPQQPIGEMHIEGFIPVIIHVIPIPNLPLLLGLDDTKGGKKGLSHTSGLGPMESKKRFELKDFDQVGLLN